jgi:hypothetical protein
MLWLQLAIEDRRSVTVIDEARAERVFRERAVQRSRECKDPLKWILCAAPMNFGSRRESLMAKIRNSTNQAEQELQKGANEQIVAEQQGADGPT